MKSQTFWKETYQTMPEMPLSIQYLQKMNAYWRTTYYLFVSNIIPFIIRQWGTAPELSFIHVDSNWVIEQHDLNLRVHSRQDMPEIRHWKWSEHANDG